MNSCLPSRMVAVACLAVVGTVSCSSPSADSSDPSTAATAPTASTSSEPAPAEPTDAPSTDGDAAAPDEIRIALFWDPDKDATSWKVGTKSASSEAELESLLQEAAAERARSGAPACPVVIDATRSVPWRDVVATLNACKKAGIATIDFAISEG